MVDVPLLEFDPERSAVFEPSRTQPPVDAPSAAVGCYFPEVIAALAAERAAAPAA